MLDTPSVSTALKTSKASAVAPTVTQVARKKRKGESDLSRLLSKAKKVKNTIYTNGLDEVKRFLANTHCKYSKRTTTMIITNNFKCLTLIPSTSFLNSRNERRGPS
jgi:hypothetical protein